MDLWEAAKVLVKRWYVAVPLLLVTAAVAAWVTASVEPEHRVTGHLAVVPPGLQRVDTTGEVMRVNPWTEWALAEAASIRIAGQALERELAAAGYQGAWTADVTGDLPVIRLEVTAPTREQARVTLDRLYEVVAAEVRDRQAAYGIVAEERIATVTYDDGDTAETVTSRLRRLLLVVAGAGLLVSVATTIAVDAAATRLGARMRARSRRRHTTPPAALPPGPGPGPGPAPGPAPEPDRPAVVS